MSQSNYKEELRKIFNNLVEEARDKGTATDGSERESYALQDALAAINLLVKTTIGKDEFENLTEGMYPEMHKDDAKVMVTYSEKIAPVRNQIRHELLAAFGIEEDK